MLRHWMRESDWRPQNGGYLVRMELQGQLSVGLLELGIRAAGVDLEGFVQLCLLDHFV